jgi:hypothetical protein
LPQEVLPNKIASLPNQQSSNNVLAGKPQHSRLGLPAQTARRPKSVLPTLRERLTVQMDNFRVADQPGATAFLAKKERAERTALPLVRYDL